MNTLPPPLPRPDHASLQAAAEWFACIDGQPSRDMQERLQQWLQAHPRHRSAWAYVQAVNADFERLSGPAAPAAHAALRAPARSRRRALGTLAALGTVGLGSWWATRPPPWPDAAGVAARARTGAGEMRALALADGAQAWLNAATQIAIDNTASARRIRLQAGEIFVASHSAQQAAAARRPLFIDTVHGSVQALGTRFSVRLDGEGRGRTLVSVFEHAVRITPAQAPGAAVTLQAGEQAWFTADRVMAPQGAAQARQAWTEGKLVADNMRLDDFLAELSAYRRGHLGCDPAVAALRLDGVFALDDTDGALAMLEQTLPVSVRRTTPWWVSVQARR